MTILCRFGYHENAYANGACGEASPNTFVYKHTDCKEEPDPQIGCIILGSPFFFPESEWISVPMNWSSNIVKGKSYNTNSIDGHDLYQEVTEKIGRLHKDNTDAAGLVNESENRYGTAQLVYPRLGQGAFRL